MEIHAYIQMDCCFEITIFVFNSFVVKGAGEILRYVHSLVFIVRAV